MRIALLLVILALAAPGAGKKHFLLTLSPTQELKKLSPAQQETLRQHTDYLNKLYLNGRLATGGKVEDANRPASLVVLEVDDEAEARRVLAGDPAVRAGLMEARIQPFFLAFPPREP